MGDEGVAGAGLFTDVTLPVSTVPATTGPTVSSSTTPATVPNPSPYDLGSCVAWDQSSSAPEFVVVACDAPHLVEVTDVILFEEGIELRFPTLEDLRFVTEEYCDEAASTYLGGAPVTDDLQAGAIPPTVEEWDGGERWFACTLGLARQDGLRPEYTGRLAESAEGA